MNYQIAPIKALKDNYIWLITFADSTHAWVIDPGEADPVLKVLAAQDLELTKILITHHHYDHSAGTLALLKKFPACKVYASHLSPHDFVSERLYEGDKIMGQNFMLEVLEIPGHTLDHLAYYNSELVFSGDTLFSAGCGRIFEGTAQQMYHSLSKLQQLPGDPKIYCGHEYTLNNLTFAKLVEPENSDVQDLITKTQTLLNLDQPSLPSQLMIERKVNPFLRCKQKKVIEAAQFHAGKILSDATLVFAELRFWKNLL